MKKVVVTGAAGLLGQALVSHLDGKADILAVDIAEDPFDNSESIKFLQADLTRFDVVMPEIEKFNPEIIFNASGMTDVDLCETEREKAHLMNVDLVKNLIALPSEKIVQFSTDFIFDGKNGPYAENDVVNPLGYYGETKLESERLLSNADIDSLIIRTNVLFGMGLNVRPNFISWLITSLLQSEKLWIANDMYNNPTHARNLAEASVEAAFSGLSGIYHIAGDSYLSRYETAIKTAEFLNLEPGLITPVKYAELNLPADRPLKGGLKIDKAKAVLKTRLLPFEEALKLNS